MKKFGIARASTTYGECPPPAVTPFPSHPGAGLRRAWARLV